MSQTLLETLPPHLRLALAYAPNSARKTALGLFALNDQLARTIRMASEPIIGQMRLAWWRETLSQDVNNWPSGNEILDVLLNWHGETGCLALMVDGWENLLGDRFGAVELEAFVNARAAACAALARLNRTPHAAQQAQDAGAIWAIADLAMGVSDPAERQTIFDRAGRLPGNTGKLPRALRPLAVLQGLARRSLAKDGAPFLNGPASAALAIRLGITGY